MCQETFVKWVRYFDAFLFGFLANFGIKMFHLFKVGFLGLGGNMYYGLFIW